MVGCNFSPGCSRGASRNIHRQRKVGEEAATDGAIKVVVAEREGRWAEIPFVELDRSDLECHPASGGDLPLGYVRGLPFRCLTGRYSGTDANAIRAGKKLA